MPDFTDMAEIKGENERGHDSGPGLQRKVELEDESRRKHELEAKGKEYEIDEGAINTRAIRTGG